MHQRLVAGKLKEKHRYKQDECNIGSKFPTVGSMHRGKTVITLHRAELEIFFCFMQFCQ